MYFKDRREAGQKLARALKKYKGGDAVVFALPRGGVVTAFEIAKYLGVPMGLIITRKIGHPSTSEYAIGAVAEDGHFVGNETELLTVDKKWLKEEILRQRLEAKRRRETYLNGEKETPVGGKIAILVDDGVATGLTIRLGIKELKHCHPKKIVVAVPVVPETTARVLTREADELIALDIPPDDDFLGAVSAYYDEFFPVEDKEVTAILKVCRKLNTNGEINQN